MWLFSCFKPDPSKVDVKTAVEISKREDEDRKARQELKRDEEAEMEKAKEESLKIAKEKEKQRRLQESKEKGKRKQVDDHKEQILNHSKDLTPPPSICNGCKTEIGDGIVVKAFDALWHPKCLCCLYCHKPIDEHEIYRNQQFHKLCYKENNHPSCYVCNKKLPRTEKRIIYNEHPFWREKYCPSHDDEAIAKCCSCERLESYGTNYVMLEDGRRLCCQCMECAVMDTDECVSLHIDIRDFFETLSMKVEKQFPLLLVEKEALNKAEEKEKIDNQYEIVTRGICLSEGQNVTNIAKRPKKGPNNRLIDMVRENQTVSGFDVTAILILYGLPRLQTGYILAHEMMHAWLRLNGYRNLNPVLEEGLCQVLAYMWLEPQRFATPDVTASTLAADSQSASSSSRTPPPVATMSKKGDQSDFEKRFVNFCIYQIETDDSPIYGLGFKKVHKMMLSNHHNIKDTLREIVIASKTTPASTT